MSATNPAIALSVVQTGVVICDRSHWGRIELGGRDRQTFLHNQSTNDIKSLRPGQGCDTVIVTSTARTIDLVTAYVLEDQVLLVTSPNRREQLLTWFDRYIFFGDQVTLKDTTIETAMFSVLGLESDRLLTDLGGGAIIGQPNQTHQLLELGGVSVRVAVGSGLAIAGYTLIVDVCGAETLLQMLREAGAVQLSDRDWEQLRIQQGRPAPGRELTEDYNPLEAGLWQTVSFNKGCYIGQETIARLDTYKGVKQQLWGVRLNQAVEPGAILTPLDAPTEKIGTLTSVAQTESGWCGLAYVRTKAGGAGLAVRVGDAEGQLVEVPFLSRDRANA
jgi:folate-binding protein YgfZ